MAGLVPAIHALVAVQETLMPGSADQFTHCASLTAFAGMTAGRLGKPNRKAL